MESDHREQSSITLSRFKDSVAWHIKLANDNFDEAAVLDRIAVIHRRMVAEYAPQELETK